MLPSEKANTFLKNSLHTVVDNPSEFGRWYTLVLERLDSVCSQFLGCTFTNENRYADCKSKFPWHKTRWIDFLLCSINFIVAFLCTVAWDVCVNIFGRYSLSLSIDVFFSFSTFLLTYIPFPFTWLSYSLPRLLIFLIVCRVFGVLTANWRPIFWI